MIGMQEMVIVGAVIGLLFGAKKLPEMGRSLGQGIREFKRSMQGIVEDDQVTENTSPNSDVQAKTGE